MKYCNPLKLHMESHVKLTHSLGTPLQDPEPYQRLVGKLIYLTITRPDITYNCAYLESTYASTTSSHYQAAIGVLRYLTNSCSQGILLV